MDLEKGICRLSIIPVRAKAGDQSEMVTQLLFGEHYTVLEATKDNKWIRIENYFDGYKGWIDIRQHNPISEEYFSQINHSDYKVCTDISASILYQKHHIQILMGSILPIATNELFKMEEQMAFNGEAKSLSQRRDFEYLKTIALKYLNAPYQWGGKSPFGIDCSGLIQQAYRICGYPLKRDVVDQALQGSAVDGFENAVPGDLAFFKNDEDKMLHAGIILDGGTIIHASGRVRIDRLDEEGIVDEDRKLYTHYLGFIRRILV